MLLIVITERHDGTVGLFFKILPLSRGVGFNIVIRALASINTPDYVEIHLYRRPTGRPSFTARLVGCSVRAPWAGVANSQTDRHRAKVNTVSAYMLALSCRSSFWHKIVKITELFALFWQF